MPCIDELNDVHQGDIIETMMFMIDARTDRELYRNGSGTAAIPEQIQFRKT